MLPQAVSVAMAEDVEFRKGLPRNYLNCMGIANMDHSIEGREAFIKKVCWRDNNLSFLYLFCYT